MPELPEVETVRRGLAARLTGRTLRRVALRRRDLRWPMPARALGALQGRKLEQVERRSKYLQLFFSGPSAPVALIHLGMTGRLVVDAPARRMPWERHEHWRMDFDGGVLRYVDARRFGILDATSKARLAQHRLIKHLGPEPFDVAFAADALFRDSRRRRVAVKTWLMDARNVVGIGNIYASEACFRAGVRPGKSIQRTTRAQCDRLVDAVRAVLRDAIAAGGTTLRDYVAADGATGWFQMSLSVYGRAGEPCLVCGAPIRRVVHGARSTYYCARCQR